jgi:hypothetical protein
MTINQRTTVYAYQSRFTKLTRLCAVAALSTAILAPQISYGHGDNIEPHDEYLDELPLGQIGLLPDDTTYPVLHGQVGPLLPMHTMSVHNTISWKKDKKMPYMLMFHRHSAYTADEVANPDVIDFLISTPNPDGDAVAYKTTAEPAGAGLGKVAFTSPLNQFNSSFRRSFNQFAYGGYTIIHDVSQSVPTRISADQTVELTQLWDMNLPNAFRYDYTAPKYSAAALTNDDALLNFSAFKNMGNSKGLFYDMYCPGSSTLSDGRPIFMGGHDMNSQNGSYRIQTFDPEAESWAPRPSSNMRKYFGDTPAAKAFRKEKLGDAFENDKYLEGYYRVKYEEKLVEAAGNVQAAVNAMQQVFLPDCDPHDPLTNDSTESPLYPGTLLKGPNGTVTHPGTIPSDMKYARWYPTQISLPNNQIIVYSGWDRDERFYPQPAANSDRSTQALLPFIALAGDYPNLPTNADLAGHLKSGGDANFLNSRVKQCVPEVYDAKTDSFIALENSPLFHSGWYPNGCVVQAGPGRNDWKVVMNDGELLGNIPAADPATGGPHKPLPTSVNNQPVPNGVQDRDLRKMWMLDVQGAMKDKLVDQPPVPAPGHLTSTIPPKYLTFVDEASNSHTAFSGNANIVELDKLGRVISHKLTHFGGELPRPKNEDGTYPLPIPGTQRSDKVEEIDFAPLFKKPKRGQVQVMPEWKVVGKMYQPGRQNYATPLPDGKILLLGGNGGTLPGIEAWSLHMQMYDPALGATYQYDPAVPFANDVGNSVTKMAKTLIPRDEHGIIQLMPDATVYLGGQNRNGLVRLGDPIAPLGDSDLGVPVGQLYRPPYLFDANAFPAPRPLILKTPSVVDYGRPFTVDVASLSGIKGVSMIRTGCMSHSLNTDVRLVKLAFRKSGNKLTVYPPKLPGTAIGGYWMLFVVDNVGVPSTSAKFQLGRDIEKRVGKPLSKFTSN